RPVYHPFAFAIFDNGREMSNNSLLLHNGTYEINFADLERRAADPRAKIMILCNPHNPIGRVWTREELTRIGDICLKNGVVLISDEIHSDLALFGHRHTPVASISGEIAQNTVTCYAPSKTFNIAGLRGSGIVVPNPELRRFLQQQFKKNRTVQQNVFALPAYIAAYTQCEDYVEQLVAYLEENVRFLDGYLKENMPRIKLIWPEATYLMWLDCRGLGLADDALNDFFTNKCLVAMNRGSSFGEEGRQFMRMNIACPRATLKEGLDRISALYQKTF
ncbi:MAG: aminotransferase class I/II-fold pyridoxal phosphate-dependent enzyme, partial [Lawsonibacter sp.]|nr:aminotransferase class I/II-fold pyridoxal phosphate-dependent enzyme [Lawsonibacter sp.]